MPGYMSQTYFQGNCFLPLADLRDGGDPAEASGDGVDTGAEERECSLAGGVGKPTGLEGGVGRPVEEPETQRDKAGMEPEVECTDPRVTQRRLRGEVDSKIVSEECLPLAENLASSSSSPIMSESARDTSRRKTVASVLEMTKGALSSCSNHIG